MACHNPHANASQTDPCLINIHTHIGVAQQREPPGEAKRRQPIYTFDFYFTHVLSLRLKHQRSLETDWLETDWYGDLYFTPWFPLPTYNSGKWKHWQRVGYRLNPWLEPIGFEPIGSRQVQVCLFAFDCMLLNGQPLVKDWLRIGISTTQIKETHPNEGNNPLEILWFWAMCFFGVSSHGESPVMK